MMNKCRLIIYFLFCLQYAVGQDLPFEQFTDRDGLPSMTTYNIVQDNSGLIWLGTENGLVSFDGDEFIRYTHPDLNDNDIIDISISPTGRIYFINLSNQFGYIEDAEITVLKEDQFKGKPTKFITIEDRNYLMRTVNIGRKIYEIEELPDNSIQFIEIDIYIYDPESHKNYIRIDKDTFQCKEDSSLLHRTKGGLRQVNGNGNYFFDQKNVQFQIWNADSSLVKHIRENGYEKLLKYEDDFIILNSKGGYYYNSSTESFQPFLKGIRINTIFFDKEDNAWISTANQGLLRISNFVIKLKLSNPILLDGVNDIIQDKNNNIYLGSLNGRVVINPFKQNKIIDISDASRPVQFSVYKNNIIAYDIQSYCKIDIESLRLEMIKNELFTHKSLLFDDPTIFIGTTVGLNKLSIDKYVTSQYRGELDFRIRLRISDLHKQMNTHKIYAGTVNGLHVLENDSFKITGIEKLQSTHISSIIDGDNNSIWIGTRSNGVYNIRNDSILSHFSTANGFISNNINNIEKQDNKLLVSTNAGLFILDLATYNIKIISEFNFLASNDVLVCKVIGEEYWIGTQDGLTIISKEDINNLNFQKPILTLKELYVNGEESKYRSGIRFDHWVNNIQLNLQNISYKSGKDKYIKYRIMKIDTTWISTTEPIIRLPLLRPGKYVIEALGVNSIGIESIPLNLNFSINRPWWETWWARLLGILLLLCIGLLIFRLRMRQEKQKRDYLTQINDIRDQALQLQMNPHFIFNSLNAIQGFIGTDDEELAMNYLARFARLIRLIFEHSKGNTISLEEELEFINLYLALEKLRFKDKVKVEITIDETVDQSKDIINLPPLLIQPIVENSFKHGLFHKKGKGTLKIDYSMNDELLRIIVEDDGIGREQSKNIIRKNTEKKTSSGIKTSLERIDLLNFGKEKKLNSMKIDDLHDDEGNPIGTRTTLNLVI